MQGGKNKKVGMKALCLFFLLSSGFYVFLESCKVECFFEDVEEVGYLVVTYKCTPEPCVFEITDEQDQVLQVQNETNWNVVHFVPPKPGTFGFCFKANATTKLGLEIKQQTLSE